MWMANRRRTVLSYSKHKWGVMVAELTDGFNPENAVANRFAIQHSTIEWQRMGSGL